jgi:hypothetical protein
MGSLETIMRPLFVILLVALLVVPAFAAKDPISIEVKANDIQFVKQSIVSAIIQSEPQYKILSDTTYQLVMGMARANSEAVLGSVQKRIRSAYM